MAVDVPQGYLAELLGHMAVRDGPNPRQSRPEEDDDLGGLDLPPGAPLDQGLEEEVQGQAHPHGGSAETDEDEYPNLWG